MNFSQNSDSLNRLVKVASTVVSDPNLLEELVQEVKNGSNGPLCSIFKSAFKTKLLNDLDSLQQFMSFFFQSSTITEIPIVSSASLGIKCFFMPKGSMFPLHDHNNKVVCTGTLFGHLRYMTLDPQEGGWYRLSGKGKAAESKVMFCTKEFRNIHSIFAVEDSVLLDIFMPNDDENDEFCVFKVLKKRNREFLLEKKTFLPHRKV